MAILCNRGVDESFDGRLCHVFKVCGQRRTRKDIRVFLFPFWSPRLGVDRFLDNQTRQRCVRKAEHNREERFIYPRRRHDRTWELVQCVLEMMQVLLARSKKCADEDMVILSVFFGPLPRHNVVLQRFWKSPLAEGGANLMDRLSVLFGSIICVFNLLFFSSKCLSKVTGSLKKERRSGTHGTVLR